MGAWGRLIVLVICAFLLAGEAATQVTMQGPRLQGVWNPVVGSGGVYEVGAKGEKKAELEIAIVGSETVGGKPGHWLEATMQEPGEPRMVIKQLIVLDSKQMQMKRVIFQQDDDPPMEMPVEMMTQGASGPETADIRQEAEHLGTESVSTPAGTFRCEHYRLREKSSELWIAEKVIPYGLVKMTSPDSTILLKRLLTNAQTRIKGTPQKFNPLEMMRRRPE